jgi:hypothetical protein
MKNHCRKVVRICIYSEIFVVNEHLEESDAALVKQAGPFISLLGISV